MLSDKKVQRILIPLGVLVITFSIIKSIKSDKIENQLKSENNYVIGKIIDHKISGIAENYFVKYEYFIEGKRYEKSEYYADQFRDCYKTRKCIGLKFIVFHKKENPRIAFMDFGLTEKNIKMTKIKKQEIKEKLENLKVN